MNGITILVPVADGSEEMEFVIIVDMLRRAGIKVIVAGQSDIITCSRNVKIIPDILISHLKTDTKYDAVILPGGLKGTENLLSNPIIRDILINHKNENLLIGAICAAPTILAHYKLLKNNTKITSHPTVSKELIYYNYSEDNVVLDDNILTSRGAGTAFDFSLKIIEYFFDKNKAMEISESIVYHNNLNQLNKK
ncbi:DJ-1/PfpI family protein [Bacteroidetes/Chlorobi group bacterium ChocPot_Mid]|nr:MAG: DJ-1/PfpI family protein [Bacteroidetes/Chlorobi group bacterium ChocPot_Mid]